MIHESLTAGKFKAIPLTESADALGLWKTVLAQSAYTPIAYTPAAMEFQKQVLIDRVADWNDHSVVLFLDGKPVGVWPLTSGAGAFASFENLVLPPLFAEDLPGKIKKEFESHCFKTLFEFSKANGALNLEFLVRTPWGAISDFTRRALESGATTNTTYDMYVDVGLGIEEIKRRTRKSYHSLISKGLKTWDVAVDSAGNADLFQQFHALHVEAAGRETRSQASWDAMFKALQDGSAFMVTSIGPATDGTRKMVGCGYFFVSKSECQYAVAAYDRSLFDQPIGHAVQYRALEHMTKLGLKTYFIGQRNYPGDATAPTPKDLSIATFKEGFMTQLQPTLRLRVGLPT